MSLTPKLALSRAKLDRDAPSRDIPDLLDSLWANPASKVVCTWRGEVLSKTATVLSSPIAARGRSLVQTP